MNRKRLSWKDCLTLLTFEEAIQHRKTRNLFSLVLLTAQKKKHEVEGTLISFNALGDDAFYFTFVFDFDGQMFYLKIKQNPKDPQDKYVMHLPYDENKISYLKNLDTKSWQREEKYFVAV